MGKAFFVTMTTILTSQNLQTEDAQVITELYYQLNPNRPSLNLAEALDSSVTYVFVYRYRKQIVGMATLGCYRKLFSYQGWVEDVVVDEAHRGKGIGKQLAQAILDKAKSLQLDKVFLYTEDEKQAAIHLYEQLGFTQRDSRLYFLNL